MFSIPGKQAVSVTPAAEAQIARLMAAGDKKGLRIGVKKGGCAGMEYTMDYVDEVDPNDEVVEVGAARVMIAPAKNKAISHHMLTTEGAPMGITHQPSNNNNHQPIGRSKRPR